MKRDFPTSPSEVTIDLDELERAIRQQSYELNDDWQTEVIDVKDLFNILRRWNP